MFEPIVIWDLEDDPDGNVAHIFEHGITQDEVEDVVGNPANKSVPSDSSGRPLTFGWTSTGRYIAVVWEHVSDDPPHHQTGDGIRCASAGQEEEEAMSVRRVYQKTKGTAAEKAELAAVREKYQRQRPSLEQALRENGCEQAVSLGELLQLHQVLDLLKRERERQQLTLADVATRANIDQAALSRLENGRNTNPTLDTIYRIAGALGKTVGCFLQDAPQAARR